MLHLILSIMPMFVCQFWVILLCMDHKQNLSKYYLALFLLVMGVNYFTHAAFFNRQYELFAFMDNIWVFTSLSAYPLYYYYIRLLTSDLKIDWRKSWILLPSLILLAFSFVVYFAMSPEELGIFIHGVMYHEPGYIKPYPPLVQLQVLRTVLFKVVFLIQLFISVYFSYHLVNRYNKELNEFYSNTGGKDLSHLKYLLLAFIFASVVSSISSVVGKEYFIDKGVLLIIPSFMHSLCLFFIGYVGYHQHFTIVDFTKDVNDFKTKELIVNTEKKRSTSKSKIIKEQLSNLLEKEELFKNPELRITDITYMLGTNRTYISNIVNEEMQTNFCDWVNSFRIDYAKKAMRDPEFENLSLLQIAEMSGFSSLSVFYRAFKAREGVAPGEFKSRKS